MELEIQRNADADAPVYRQIADQIRARVEHGDLHEGDRLPPIRTLAASLGVNRDTVSTAYETLAAEGVVDARVGRGTFVRGRRPRGPVAGAPVPVRLSQSVERLLDLERSRPAYGAGRDVIALHALKPDPRIFPIEPFRRALNRAFAEIGPEILDYGGPQGHPALREAVAERVRVDGALVGPESVVLCQGASQGISLALRLFADAGDVVAIEEPTYQNALATIAGLGLQAVPIPMRRDGPDLDALDAVLSRPEVRLFYTIPTFHNPMGITTNRAHREELLRIAGRYGKPVIEDAYEKDLRFTGRPVPSLLGLDQDALVVQLLSFSKSLFPGLRAGAIVARGRHVDALLALRHAADLGGALPLQVALADFMRTGAYERHLATVRRELRKRRDVFCGALEREMPEGTTWTVPEGGFQIWLELPEPLDSRELHADLLREGVLIAPGHQFQLDGRPSRGMRLSIALADEAALCTAAAKLGRVAKERLDALGGTAPNRVVDV